MRKSIDRVGFRAKLHDGMSIIIGGFLANGTPERTVDVLVEYGAKDLTMIVNDTSYPDRGCGRPVANKQVRHLIVSHIGMSSMTAKQMNNDELRIELSPQGTLAEHVRVDGCGLGGVLTTTGLDTIIIEGKKVINISGQDYLLELPPHTDMIFIRGIVSDETDNLVYKDTAQNFQPLMAMAADYVVVEIDELVLVGQINPEAIHTSGILVDYAFE